MAANPLRRLLRRPAKTLQAAWRWKRLSFSDAPAIFGNSKPKSGSHLLLQILNGLTQVIPYKYVEADPVRTITKAGRKRTQVEILKDLASVPRGVIGWGYVDATPQNVRFLCRPGRVNYFIYRDPRDMLVSQVFYATGMRADHGMRAYYDSLPDFGARLKVAITGLDQDGLYMAGVRQRYETVFEWLQHPEVMCLRFEDLVRRRDETLNAMLDEVEKTGYRIPTPRDQALALLVEAIRPEKSHTFRSGKTEGWREHFTEAHKHLFKSVAGDLLVRLGYEENNDW